MERVIITIKIENIDEEYDFDIPSDITSKILIEKLIRIFSVKSIALSKTLRYVLKIDFQNRILKANETLNEAGVWDGSILTLIKC